MTCLSKGKGGLAGSVATTAAAAPIAIASKTAAKVTAAAAATACAAVKTDTAAFLWRPMPKPRDDKQRGNQ